MIKYIAKRVLMAAVTIFCILFVLFLLMQFMPGSPFNDEKLSAEQVAVLEAKYGLDKPFLVQFFNYLKNMLTGDFGVSYAIQKNLPITTLIGNRLWISIRLGLQAAVLGSFIGLILGIVAALRKHTVFDTAATVVSVVGVSLPSFVFALLLSYFFAYKNKIFPLMYSTEKPLMSTVLPTIALSVFTIASISRYTRTEIIEVMQSDYVTLAKAKGITKVQLIIKHVLRNALISIVTVLAPLVVNLLTGSLVIEKAFSIPGLGTLFVNAIQQNDYNVTMAIAFIYSTLFILVMLVVDILYGVIDPRIRLAKGEE